MRAEANTDAQRDETRFNVTDKPRQRSPRDTEDVCWLVSENTTVEYLLWDFVGKLHLTLPMRL